MQTEILVEKIKQLPQQRIAEVEDFVDFLAQREEQKLVQAKETFLKMHSAKFGTTEKTRFMMNYNYGTPFPHQKILCYRKHKF